MKNIKLILVIQFCKILHWEEMKQQQQKKEWCDNFFQLNSKAGKEKKEGVKKKELREI